MTAATMLFASSCSKEQISTNAPVGEAVTVTLTADLGAIESRAISDGLKVNEVAWAIYTEGAATPLPDYQGVLPINEKKGTLEVRLVTGRKYDIALFAYYTENPATEQVNVATPAPKYYQVDWNNKLVAVQYPEGPLANENDARDCFWYVEKALEVNAPVTKTFTLTRPLAQLNFGVSAEDTVAAADAGLAVSQSKIVASTYTQFNMFTGECLDAQPVELTFAQNDVPAQKLNVQNIDYTYIGTAYLLVNEKELQDVKITIYNGNANNAEINTLEYTNVPFQRNYRTNILGALLTNPADFTIKVDEHFNEPDFISNNKVVTPDANGVYNIDEPEEFAWLAAVVNSGENDFAGKQVVIPADALPIDLKGVKWTPIGVAGKPFRGSFNGNGVAIRNLTVNTTECAGLFGNVVSPSIENVVLENVNITSSHYAGAVVGYAYANITNCSVDGLTMTVTPNDITRATYDNGDKVGGIVGYVGENGYKISNNTVTNAEITAYRDLGGIAGAGYLKECVGNTVKDVKITSDQETNFYETKKANAGEIVGRVLGGEIGENTVENVTLDYHLTIEEVLAIGAKNGLKTKGWVLATSKESMILADDTGWIFCYRPKGYANGLPAVGSVISLKGNTTLYPTSGDVRMLQFNQLAVITELGRSVEVVHPEPEVFDAAKIDTWVTAPTRTYATLKGVLNISKSGNSTYYNIVVDGTENIGAILAPKADDLERLTNGLDGKPIEVKGYTAYTNSTGGKKIVQMVITELKDFYEATEWGVVGDMTGWGSNPDITMYTYGDGFAFAKGVEVAEGQGFKIRANNEWNDAKNYGTNDVKVYSNMPVPVYTGGGSGNLYPTEAGTYDIYFDIANLDKVYVMTAGTPIDEALPYEKFEEPQLHVHTWRIVGGFNGWNPADDNYLMTLSDDNKWATIVAEFASDTELKFVANGEWSINRGNGVTVELDKEYEGYQDGANINVPAGKYQIKLNMCDGRFVFKKPIAVVEETITFDNTAKRTEFSTSKQVWVEGDITVTNEKSKSTSSVANYSKPARFYKSSKLVVSVPGDINQIEFDCNSSSYATALKNSIKAGGTVSVASDKVTVVLDTPATSFEIPELSGGQVRLDGLKVTYMKEM